MGICMRNILPKQGRAGQCSERIADKERLEMDGDEVYMHLPEDLVERILAMVPYPQIFKVRVLSKSWATRFSPFLSLNDDEEKRQRTISFQKRVSEYSDKPRAFCPVFIGIDHLIAYDQKSQDWQKIPTLSFLSENHPVKSAYPDLEIEGALMLTCLWMDPVERDLYLLPDVHTLHVANVFTRSWKRLPTPDIPDGVLSRETKLVSYKDRYKVICFCYYRGNYCLTHTYDSHSEAWSNKSFDNTRGFTFLTALGKNLNGILYWVGTLNEVGQKGLLAFNLKEETFEVLHMPPIDFQMKSVHLVVCNASLLLVVYKGEASRFDSVTVLKIDVEFRTWVAVSEGPPCKLPLGSFEYAPVGDGDCICFIGNGVGKFLVYNVQRDEWSDFIIPASVTLEYRQCNHRFYPWVFRTGLNSFVAL